MINRDEEVTVSLKLTLSQNTSLHFVDFIARLPEVHQFSIELAEKPEPFELREKWSEAHPNEEFPDDFDERPNFYLRQKS
jgi:hypothetical protein